MGGNGQSFDQIKRAFLDLVNELHARKLAIPAGALVVAIFAAIFMLPKSPAPPPPVPTAPVAQEQQTVPAEAVVHLKLVGVSSLDDKTPIADSEDPFDGKAGYQCVRVGSGEPKRFDCLIGDIMMHFTCMPDVTEGVCGDTAKGGGATGSTGGTGGDGGSTGGTGEPQPETKPKTHTKTTYYVVDVTIDGRTYNNVVAGDSLPNAKNPLAYFAGTEDSGKKALFIAGDGVTVTGTTVDPELGNFELSKGKSVTITDAGGTAHSFKLKSISKVTK